MSVYHAWNKPATKTWKPCRRWRIERCKSDPHTLREPAKAKYRAKWRLQPNDGDNDDLCEEQSRQWVDGSWVNGSNGSFFEWVTWVMGQFPLTHDPCTSSAHLGFN